MTNYDTTDNVNVTGNPADSPTTWGPIATFGQTALPSFLFIGDSRGFTADLAALIGFPELTGTLAPTVDGPYPYINMSMAGEGLQSYLTNNTVRLAAASGLYLHVIIQLKANDFFNGGLTADQVITLTRQVAALFPTSIICLTTTEPWSNGPTAAAELEAILFNNAVRAGTVVQGAVCLDISAVVETSLNSRVWRPGYASDSRHETNLAKQDIQAKMGATPFPPNNYLSWQALTLPSGWANLGSLSRLSGRRSGRGRRKSQSKLRRTYLARRRGLRNVGHPVPNWHATGKIAFRLRRDRYQHPVPMLS